MKWISKSPFFTLFVLSAYVLFLLQLSSCAVTKEETLRPSGLKQVKVATIGVGDNRVVFVDNTAIQPVHLAGYNGIASWQFRGEDSTLFVPLYAGFNLEHIFGGDSLEQLFEPRRHPMSLFMKNDSTVILYQSPTPLSGVESITEFTVVPPHYIDVNFLCKLQTDTFFRHGYTGIFWASYINHPDDKKIYFRGMKGMEGEPSWMATYSDEHGVNSTHLSIKDTHDIFFAENFNAKLASHFSGFRFIEPYYYGRIGKMCFAYLFDSNAMIRFSQSPTGGGDLNPAWDFQWIIPNAQPKKIYSFRARLIYKRFVSAEDISEEYKKWESR